MSNPYDACNIVFIDPPDRRRLECTHNCVIIQQGQPDLQDKVHDSTDIIHSDPPEQDDPCDDHQDAQGAGLSSNYCGPRKYKYWILCQPFCTAV